MSNMICALNMPIWSIYQRKSIFCIKKPCMSMSTLSVLITAKNHHLATNLALLNASP